METVALKMKQEPVQEVAAGNTPPAQAEKEPALELSAASTDIAVIPDESTDLDPIGGCVIF